MKLIKPIHFAIGLSAIAYILGLFTQPMEIDSVQYANISLDMLTSGDWLTVLDQGGDYLDKPPLTFWMSCISYSIFGVSPWSFKLPALLFALLAVFSVYKLTLLYYDMKTAQIAALMLLSCEAWFLFTQDVRTDVYLAGGSALALWQIMAWYKSPKMEHVLLGAFGAGLALLAKGPIGLAIPLFGLFVQMIMDRRWKIMFHWHWIVFGLVALLVLSPMMLGLYQQFGEEGLHFYFWLQSFGRITGESKWDNDGGFSLFFGHTTLWAFFPWSVPMLGALATMIYYKVKGNKTFVKEYFTIGLVLLGFLALSMSKYKLPHYIFVVYPALAVISAAWLRSLNAKSIKKLSIIFTILSIILWVAIVGLSTYPFGLANGYILVLLIIGLLAFAWCIRSDNGHYQVLLPIMITVACANISLNGHFYPHLLKYQGSSELGIALKAQGVSPKEVVVYRSWERSFYFNMGELIESVNAATLKELSEKPKTTYVYTNQEGFDMMTERKLPFEVFLVQDDYPITRIQLSFLIPEHRSEILRKRYILKLGS